MFRKSKSDATAVEFCERCGSACDARCRAEAARWRALDRTLLSRAVY